MTEMEQICLVSAHSQICLGVLMKPLVMIGMSMAAITKAHDLQSPLKQTMPQFKTRNKAKALNININTHTPPDNVSVMTGFQPREGLQFSIFY